LWVELADQISLNVLALDGFLFFGAATPYNAR
jgi:hypothetical protein